MDTAELEDLLRTAVERGASDLHLTAGAVPHLRIDGELLPLDAPKVTAVDTEEISRAILPPRKAAEFEQIHEADFGYEVPNLARFRVNVFRARSRTGMAFRTILAGVPSFEELGLPPVLEKLASTSRGLILVTGPAGTGKTTTIAAMVAHVNRTRRAHIVTMEDPIEVLHENDLSIVDQREVGVDTTSYEEGLRHVLRQDPDVIVIGEIRDRASMVACIQAAETGHLVISTLHTLDATETVNRAIDLFPPEQQREARISLAAALAGVVSQRLIHRAEGAGRVPAVEVLISTGRVQERILEHGGTFRMLDVIADGDFYGMQTFEQSLVGLVDAGLITEEEAKANSTNPHDLVLALSGSMRRG